MLHQYSLVLLKIIWRPGTIDHETLVSNFISDQVEGFLFFSPLNDIFVGIL